MRVLHFYKTYYPDSIGGVERVINQIARATSSLGVQTEILTLTDQCRENTIKIDDHVVHRAKMDFQIASTGFSASSFIHFIRLSKWADVIHYHYPWPFMDMVHLISRVKKPTLVTYHSDIIRQKMLLCVYRPLRNLFLNSIDHIIATSPNYFETSKVLNKFHTKTTIIPIGIDKETYPVPAESCLAKWRSRFAGRFFLFVGVLRYYKGLHILIEALIGQDYPVVIIGSGPVENELKAHVEKLGLKNIHFLGMLHDEDKVALLMLCYAFIFPSHLRSEAFGVSLLEGAMYGKPLISSELGTGTSYINVHQKTGLVVPPGDAQALQHAMRFLWDNHDIAKAMGAMAQLRYMNLFTATQMGKKYVAIYNKLLEI